MNENLKLGLKIYLIGAMIYALLDALFFSGGNFSLFNFVYHAILWPILAPQRLYLLLTG